jgi:hypothetical protein
MAALKTLSLILCGLVLQESAAGAELAIHFTAIQKILAQLVFTQDGRKYLRGAPTARCNYAYLENPVVGGDGGVLKVNARFSGRSALDVFGKCIGLGDSFEASITALPCVVGSGHLRRRGPDPRLRACVEVANVSVAGRLRARSAETSYMKKRTKGRAGGWLLRVAGRAFLRGSASIRYTGSHEVKLYPVAGCSHRSHFR